MFGFNLDKRTIIIILGVLLLMTLIRLSGAELISLLLTLPGVIVAITFHEFAHAFAADRLGDTTPRMQGRVNLNPASHIDPVGFVMLLFAHIGWGKPVQINPNNFNRKYSMSAGEAIVSIAGPLMNFLLSIVFSIIYALVFKFAATFFFTTIGAYIEMILRATIIVNIGLGVFNLIPIPPLDGSKILMHFLPYNAKSWFRDKEYLFYIIFLVIWITGIGGIIIDPIIDVIYGGLINLIGFIIGM